MTYVKHEAHNLGFYVRFLSFLASLFFTPELEPSPLLLWYDIVREIGTGRWILRGFCCEQLMSCLTWDKLLSLIVPQFFFICKMAVMRVPRLQGYWRWISTEPGTEETPNVCFCKNNMMHQLIGGGYCCYLAQCLKWEQVLLKTYIAPSPKLF